MVRLSVVATLALFASPALAEHVEVTCASSSPYISDTTICDTLGAFSFQAEGPEVQYFLILTAPASHCSDVSYLIYKPGEPNPLGVSTRLASGQSQNVEIGKGYGPGAARVDIGAIGYVGGCNTGTIGNWAVDVNAAPVP